MQSDKMKAAHIPLKESCKASSEHCADKPAPRPGRPDGCQANCYMPPLSAAIWLDSDCKLPLGNHRLKMDNLFWQKKVLWSSVAHMASRNNLDKHVNGCDWENARISVDKCIYLCVCTLYVGVFFAYYDSHSALIWEQNFIDYIETHKD